ncbi:DUF5810 domain-containing protein [Halorubrum rubrum]|uniref:DUF5810 domain-containing protein n=1 Tax=Halorubrum rubrum TaxID=1126240 RepID=A0ABD5QXG5_9EURY|nr:DUF5810 domain-containing protein [Halorubrum rubrum]
MGYACPVCATPQRDGEHLAHHLAFTAMLHGDDHEAWLDEYAPEWAAAEPAELAAVVVDHAEPAEYHEVFEDTTDRGRPAVDAGMGGHGEGGGHDHGSGHAHGHGHARGHGGSGGMDPETAAAVEEARELTREMYEAEAGDDESDHGGDADGESDAGRGDGDGN